MTRRRSSRAYTWVEESLARYLERHPRSADRVTPLSAPTEDLVAALQALLAGKLPRLADLPEVDLSRLAGTDTPEAAQGGLLVNYYARVVARGCLDHPRDLLAGLSGLDREDLARLETGFHEYLVTFGDLAARLTDARGAIELALTRLRTGHNKFAEVATAERHRETAHLWKLRQMGQRAPRPDEFLRAAPARTERVFRRATGKLVVASREIEATGKRLYDPGRWPAATSATTAALEALRGLRGEVDATAGRAASYPKIRRALADLRSASAFALGRAEEAALRIRLPSYAESRRRQALAPPAGSGSPTVSAAGGAPRDKPD